VPEYKPDEVPVRGEADFYSLASTAKPGGLNYGGLAYEDGRRKETSRIF
jgi:hypothetical protein